MGLFLRSTAWLPSRVERRIGKGTVISYGGLAV
jgi:hypothetical protein